MRASRDLLFIPREEVTNMDHDPVASIQTLPAIALRGLTVFPNVLIHFDVGRAASIKAMEAAMAAGEPVFLVGQKDMTVERPERDDLYTVGTLSNVRQILRMPGDNVRVMVEGISRARLRDVTQREPYLMAEIEAIPEEKAGRASAKTEALMRSTYEMFQNYTELAPKISPDLLINVLASDDPGYIADYIAQNIAMRNSDKQAILEELRPVRRLERMYRLLCREVEILSLDMEIQSKAREQMSEQPAGLLPPGADEGHPERAGRERETETSEIDGVPAEDRRGPAAGAGAGEAGARS